MRVIRYACVIDLRLLLLFKHSVFGSLSQGCFRVSQILEMESSIIKSLSWRLNPPSSFIYLDVASPVIDECVDGDASSQKVKDLSKYLLELSVYDGYFAYMKPSLITHAAISAAMDTLSIPDTKLLLCKLDKSPRLTESCKQRLCQIHRTTLLQLDEEGKG